MHVILSDVHVYLRYGRCFMCGCILLFDCTLLSNGTIDDVLFMFALLEHKVPHTWKRTGPSQCHRMCLSCQTALARIKKDLAVRAAGERHVRYHKERLIDFLVSRGLGDWKCTS